MLIARDKHVVSCIFSVFKTVQDLHS